MTKSTTLGASPKGGGAQPKNARKSAADQILCRSLVQIRKPEADRGSKATRSVPGLGFRVQGSGFMK